MMDTMTLCRLELDGHHITAARHTLDDARVAAGLRASGVNAGLYVGRPDGQLQDVARQLARTRARRYVFHVTRNNHLATLNLAKELSRLRGMARFAVWGDVEGCTSVRDPFMLSVDLISATCIVDVVRQLLEIEEGDGSAAGAAVSPYLDGLLVADDLVRLGLSSGEGDDHELLANELAWLSKQPLPSHTLVSLDIPTLKEEGVVAIASLIANAGVGAAVSVQLRGAASSSRALLALSGAGVRHATVHGRRTEDFSKVDDSLLSLNILDSSNEERSGTYAKNGMIAFHTGMYFDVDRSPSPGIYHLHLPPGVSAERRHEAHLTYGANLALRSAEIIHDDESLRSEFEDELSGWPKHTYRRQTLPELAIEDIYVDGAIVRGGRTGFIPLGRFDEGATRDGDVTIVTIRDEADINALENRLKAFHESGTVRGASVQAPVYFENSCRWMRYGACRVTNLRRLSIHQEGDVSTCIDAGSIASSSLPYDKLLTLTRQRAQTEEARRGCAICPVRSECSHCSALPLAYSDRYCILRKTYPLTSVYFELFGFPHLLGSRISGGVEASVDMSVSWSGLPSLVWKGSQGEAPEGERPIFVATRGDYFVWWRGTRRVIRMSRPLMTMAEAWWLGAPKEEVAEQLSEEFGVDRAVAEASYSEGLLKLAQGGVIHG